MLTVERETTSTASDTDARIRDLEIQLERLTAEYEDLSNMGAFLASILDLEGVLAALMDTAIRLVGGQVGAIVLTTPDGLKPNVSWGLDYRVLPRIRWGAHPIAERTVSQTEGALLAPYTGPPIAIDGLVLHIETAISQPIVTKTGTVGCIVVVNKQMGGTFSERDRLVLTTLVNFASVAVENARLLSESLEKQRLEHELDLAEKVQKTLVPRSDLTVGGVRLDSLYIPARHVGGDYFDILPREDGTFLLAVGDVSSKGVPAALLMTAARSVVRAAAARTGSVAQIVNEINRVVCADLTDQKEMFITFFLALVDPNARTITYTNAGHPPPLLLRQGTGAVEQLGRGGVFLGQFRDFDYIESAIDFAPGDHLLAFTDGIVEAADDQGNLFGRPRVQQFLQENAQLAPTEFLNKLRRTLEDNFGHADYIDDVTAVYVELGKATE